MRIAINCRSILLNQRTGIGRYTYHLIDNLGRIDQDNHYTLHAPKRLFDRRRSLPDFSRYKNFKKHLDYFAQGSGEADIYHMPAPDPIPRHQGKLVVTVHDLIYKTYPQGHEASAIALTEKNMQGIVRQADHIICISESTRRDLHQYLDFPKEKSSVIYNGVDAHLFRRLSAAESRQAADEMKALGVLKPFILYVGTIEPRKNLAGLLEAFAQIKKDFNRQLVVVGMKGWMIDHIAALISKLGIKDDVLFTGFISDEKLVKLYNRSEVFVFPSFYEGFGFPIVEAFCCGAAVISSNTSSCAEIAGDGALQIDPQDPKAMAQAIRRVLQDENLKRSLSEAGMRRAGDFSFVTTAQKTLELYQKVYRGQRRP